MDLQKQFEDMISTASEIILKGDISEEDFRTAERSIETVLSMDRDNAALVFLMGSLYMRAGRLAVAEHFLRRSLDMDPNLNEACNNLGFVCEQEGRRPESIEFFERALVMKPDSPEIINNVATAYVNNGTPDRAIELCNQALVLDPDSPDPQWNRGLAHLEKGDWVEGWAGYKTGLSMTDMSTQHRKYRSYGTDGEPPDWEGTAGKSVFIYGEQGVGDEIMAASMLPDAIRDADVVFEAHPRLVNLMRASFGDDIPIYGTRKVNWRELPFLGWHAKPDAKCAIFSLGQMYRTKDSDFPRTPYLKPYADRVEHYKDKLAKLSDRPKIGISWKGGSVRTRNDLRSIPLQEWERVFSQFDVDWISLQYDSADDPGHNAPVVAGFNEATQSNLHHWTYPINDIDECYGGLIHALDLVITVNTSLVHACGAMGVPCWTLTPSRPAWRYQVSGKYMAWYGDHVTQYRQEGDDWDSVLDQVITDLGSYLAHEVAA